jgi:nitroreductase
MDILEAIRSRRSIGKVRQDPLPRELIETLLAAAVVAPNHHETEPWRFFVLAGRAREELGAVMERALRRRLTGEDAARVEGLALAERAKPLRAPVLIVVAVKRGSRDKVVPAEDFAATAAAVENILLAATALGLGAQWRTGDAAYDPAVKAHFGLAPEDEIVAIVYLGYPDPERDEPRVRRRDFVARTEWRGWE